MRVFPAKAAVHDAAKRMVPDADIHMRARNVLGSMVGSDTAGRDGGDAPVFGGARPVPERIAGAPVRDAAQPVDKLERAEDLRRQQNLAPGPLLSGLFLWTGCMALIGPYKDKLTASCRHLPCVFTARRGPQAGTVLPPDRVRGRLCSSARPRRRMFPPAFASVWSAWPPDPPPIRAGRRGPGPAPAVHWNSARARRNPASTWPRWGGRLLPPASRCAKVAVSKRTLREGGIQ